MADPKQARPGRGKPRLFPSVWVTPETEAVLLSTCNRVELYTAAENSAGAPSHHDVVHFLADFHQMNATDLFDDLFGMAD